MRYLFIDINCANYFHGNGKICEFGYALVDENFNMINKYGTPINPGNFKEDDARFELETREKEFAYSLDAYYVSPRFTRYYLPIKNLIEDKNTLVLGYGIRNTIECLNYATYKYNLSPYLFMAYDIKVFFDKYKQDNPDANYDDLLSTYKYFLSYNELDKLNPYKSEDAAYLAMRALEALCKAKKMNLNGLVKECPNAIVSEDNVILMRRLKLKRNESVEEIINSEPAIDGKRSPGQIKWDDYYHLYLNAPSDPKYKGKIVTVSGKVKNDYKIMVETIKLIEEKQFAPADLMHKSNYLIVLDEDDRTRLKTVLKKPYLGEMITFEEFKKLNKDNEE